MRDRPSSCGLILCQKARRKQQKNLPSITLVEDKMGSLVGGSMIGNLFGDWSQTCAEATAFRAFFLLAFLVDTASEPLPKRFGRQALGHAKRTSTINSPEMSSPREIREGQNKRRLK